MLDFVALAMLVVSLVLSYSIYQIRVRKRAKFHRNLQIGTAVVLTLALIAFEVDVRFVSRWRELAEASPYYRSGLVDLWLIIHLVFAIPTPFVWGYVIITGLRRFKTGFDQGNYNRTHRTLGRIAAGLMFMTAITGWVFYYLAFVASQTLP